MFKIVVLLMITVPSLVETMLVARIGSKILPKEKRLAEMYIVKSMISQAGVRSIIKSF